MADYPLCIDISHHNTVQSFDQVSEAGIIGVIHKATEGSSFSDADYWTNRDAAHAAGLEWASYHFLKHGNVAAQIDNFLSIVDPDDGERVVIDYEDEKATLEDLRAAITEIRSARPDLEITVYSGHLLKEHLGGDYDPILATTSLWIAHYTDEPQPTWPYGTWPVWTLWQFTDGAKVPGMAPPTDLNRFNGSEENFRLWFNPQALAPEPAPTDQIVTINIKVPEGISVMVFVNGEPQI